LEAGNRKLKEQNAILLQRDSRFQLLSINSPDTILFQNTDLIYTWVINSTPLMAVEQVIGKTDFELLSSTEARRVVEIKKTLLKTGGSHYEEVISSTQTSSHHFSIYYHAWHDVNGKVLGIATYSRDINEQKLAENNLKQQLEGEELVAAISSQFINAEIAHIDSEIPTSLQKMANYLDADRGFIRFVNPEDNIIQRGFEWKDPSLREHKTESSGLLINSFEWIHNQLKNNQSVFVSESSDIPSEAVPDKEFVKNAGYKSFVALPLFIFNQFSGYIGFGSEQSHPFWSEREKGRLDLFRSTIVGVMERQQREAILNESKNNYRGLVENIPGVVYRALCDEHFTTIFISDYFEKLTFIKTDDVLFEKKLSWMEIVHPEDRSRLESCVNSSIKDHSSFEIEYRLRRADGEYIWVADTGRVTYDENDHPLFIHGIMTDISDRKRDYEEMRRLSQENFRLMAKAYHDSEAKSLLLNEVNHRVKNNLASILGILELEKKRDIQSSADFLNALSDIGSRISGIAKVHEILSSNQWAPVQLDILVRKVIENASASSPLGRKLQLSIQSQERKIWINSRQATALALILNELTTNSIRHAFSDREKGTITMTIRMENIKTHRVRIEFADDGPGWPENILTGGFGGVGLQVIQLSEASPLNGEIKFENRDGAVAVITFILAPQREPLPSMTV
jgi:PAS domain S-box-containing protein